MINLAKTLKATRALKRLSTLRSIHSKPDALRRRLGLKRRKVRKPQNFLKVLTR